MAKEFMCHPVSAPKHMGQHQESNQCFFAQVPVEIGRLESAETDYTQTAPGKYKSRHRGMWWVLAVVFFIVYGFIASAIGFQSNNWLILAACIIAAGFLAKLTTDACVANRCTYLGTNGFAIATQKAIGGIKIESTTWQDIDHVFSSRTHNYQNGVYTGTNVKYRMVDKQGKNKIKLYTNYNRNLAPKNLKNSTYNFIEALETKWMDHKGEEMNAKLKKGEWLKFPLQNKSHIIYLRKNEMKIEKGGKNWTFARNEVKNSNLKAGTYTLTPVNGKKVRFIVNGMAEQRLFFRALDICMGIRWN